MSVCTYVLAIVPERKCRHSHCQLLVSMWQCHLPAIFVGRWAPIPTVASMGHVEGGGCRGREEEMRVKSRWGGCEVGSDDERCDKEWRGLYVGTLQTKNLYTDVIHSSYL